MHQPASSFDWVSARNACSTRAVFESLKLAATEDVKVINTLRGKLQFTIVSDVSGDEFSVLREETSPQRLVSFSMTHNEISIKPSTGNSFRVNLSLNNSGECKLRIKGRDEDLELWQLLRIGLEDLFFEPSS
jgi:hypothetical protein